MAEVSPHAEAPLPPYVANWTFASSLRRPTHLPEYRDHRLDTASVFFFETHPETDEPGPFYVTRKACERCSGQRQFCDRSWPACGRCRDPEICTSDTGWVKIPRPKIIKNGKTSSRATEKKASITRVERKARDALGDGARISVRKTHGKTAPVNGRSKFVKSAHHGRPRNLEQTGPDGLLLGDEAMDVETQAEQRMIDAASLKGPVHKSKANLFGERPNWTPVPPPHPKSVDVSKRPLIRAVPRIWASSVKDLSDVLPYFSPANPSVHSIHWPVDYGDGLKPPLVLLARSSWEDDGLEERKVTLTLAYDFDTGSELYLPIQTKTTPYITDDSVGASSQVTPPEVIQEDPDASDPNANIILEPSQPPLDTQVAPLAITNQESSSHLSNSAVTSPTIQPVSLSDPTQSHVDNRKDYTGSEPEFCEPREIQYLHACQKHETPVVLVASSSCALLPFCVDEEMDIMFLGFFKILHIKLVDICTNLKCSKITSKRKLYKLTLDWFPGGEDVKDGEKQPCRPWWLPPAPCELDNEDKSTSTPTQHTDDDSMWQQGALPQDECSNGQLNTPFSLLPPDLCIHHPQSAFPNINLDSDDNMDVDGDKGVMYVSEVVRRAGWHCRECGKLNVQISYRFQRCGKCEEPNGAAPIAPFSVRNPYNTSITAFPGDICPPDVSYVSHKNPGNEMLTYVYTYRPDLDCHPIQMTAESFEGREKQQERTVTHVFTCNEPSNHIIPDKLFAALQGETGLTWHNAKSPLAAGPYFTYFAGPEHDLHSSIPWDDTPVCVSRARQFMERVGCNEGMLGGFTVENLTILAWYTSGKRKGPVLNTRNSIFALLSLGADVELTITPNSTDSGTAKAVSTLSMQRIKRAAKRAQEQSAEQHIDVDVNVESVADDQYNLIEEETAFAQLAFPKHTLSSLSSARLSNRGTRLQKEPSSIFALVHGDMLIISGGEFEWAMKRTGMSIVLIGEGTIEQTG